MSADAQQYLCPACGFRVFNRRYPRCEGCGANLPEEMLLSAEERAALDLQHQQARREREREKEAQRARRKDDAGLAYYAADYSGACADPGDAGHADAGSC